MGSLSWLTWASLKTGMSFLEHLPWAEATPHPYTLTHFFHRCCCPTLSGPGASEPGDHICPEDTGGP